MYVQITSQYRVIIFTSEVAVEKKKIKHVESPPNFQQVESSHFVIQASRKSSHPIWLKHNTSLLLLMF